MTRFSNAHIAHLLREIAAAYDVKGEDRFRIQAYHKAADSVEHATSEVKDLWDDGRLEEVPGIGPSIAQHLDEFFRKGRVAHFDAVRKGLPRAMFFLIDVPGVGAKTAYKLAKELHLKGRSAEEVIENLKEAAEAEQIRALEGFGEKSEEELLKGISEWKKRTGRMLLPIAWSFAAKVLAEVKKHPSVKRADPLGSLRRGVATIGDIDIAVASTNPQEFIEFFVALPFVRRILAAGGKKASVIWQDGRQIDIRAQDEESYGALLQYFTGSKMHNIHLRKLANERGYSLSEYGIKKLGRRGSVTFFATEEEFYRFLRMDWIPPELREDRGEIEASLEHSLPQLVEDADIRGDLHSHTTWSDGELSVEELVARARELGRSYLGITDHQPSIRTLGERRVEQLIRDRKKDIERVDKKYQDIKVFNGVEVDIYADKTLGLPEHLLATYDYAIASIHTSFRQSKEEMTERILCALGNPHVKILGHPTGRLLGEREGYEADWPRIFKFCAQNGKFMEINSFPSRLDLPDDLVYQARELGVKFTLGTDAHQEEQLELLPFGTSVARRGWCEKKDILNTLSAERIVKELKAN